MLNSIEHGKIERLEGVRTIADGIAVKEPGIHTFDLCQQYVDEIVSVTDDEISTAILALIEQHKLAAAMFNKVPIKGKKVICLISGGNIDVNILSRVIGRGLQKSGRSCSMTIELVDKPGQLQHVSEIIASTGANVVSVYHERVSHTADINGCYLRLEMETRNQQQINEIRQLLTVSGYKIVEG
jgi:threonine dehydratase